MGNPLVPVIQPLPPRVKQAFYAAANKGSIKRGTWEGCAFNAGGKEVGGVNINNHELAARVFQIPVQLVSRFISAWDDLPGDDNTCTEQLRQAILQVGLFTEPNTSGRVTRIERIVVFKSQMDEFEQKMAEGKVELADEAALFLMGQEGNISVS